MKRVKPAVARNARELAALLGLTPANVADGIRQLRPRCTSLAVDVSSGVEASKGIKDAAKIRDFVAAVRAADRAFSN